VARSEQGLQAVAAGVREAADVPVATATADVADQAALIRALDEVGAALGPPSVVVFNGSAYVEGSPLALTTADLRHAMDVGVTGALVTAQATAPALRARAAAGGPAALLLTGSVSADLGSTAAAAVGVAKAGVRNLARSLHKELAGDDVRVVTVTIDGTLQGPNAIDLDQLADHYWALVLAESVPGPEVRFPV
jgi:NAD(P)-dependent dehydrogenase (short-subunit alcohol dehydrogenase family)